MYNITSKTVNFIILKDTFIVIKYLGLLQMQTFNLTLLTKMEILNLSNAKNIK